MAAYTYEVLYDFAAEDEGELTVSASDIVYYFANGAVHPEGWILVENSVTHEAGFVPEAYVQFLRDGGPPEQQIEVGDDERNETDGVAPFDNNKGDNVQSGDDDNHDDDDDKEHNIVASIETDDGVHGGANGPSMEVEIPALNATPPTDDGAMTLGSLNGVDNVNGDIYISSGPEKFIHPYSTRKEEIIDVENKKTIFNNGPNPASSNYNTSLEKDENIQSPYAQNDGTSEVAPRKVVGFAEVEEAQEAKPNFEESRASHEDNDVMHDHSNSAALSSQRRYGTGNLKAGDKIVTGGQFKPSPRASSRFSSSSSSSSHSQHISPSLRATSPQPSPRESPRQSNSTNMHELQRNESPPPAYVVSSTSSEAYEEYKSAVQKKKASTFKPSVRASPRSSFTTAAGCATNNAVDPQHTGSGSNSIITATDTSKGITCKPLTVAPATSPIRVAHSSYMKPPTASVAGPSSRSTSPYSVNSARSGKSSSSSNSSSNCNIGVLSPASLPPMQLNTPAPLKPNLGYGSSSSNNGNNANSSSEHTSAGGTNVFSSRGLVGPTTPNGNLSIDKKKHQYASSASVVIPTLSVSFEHGGLEELICETEQIFEKLEGRQKESTTSLLKSLDDVVDGVKQTLHLINGIQKGVGAISEDLDTERQNIKLNSGVMRSADLRNKNGRFLVKVASPTQSYMG